MAKKKHLSDYEGNLRDMLAADVAAFVKSGNKIEQVPRGVSGQDPLVRSKHIVLGGSRKR